MNKKNMKKAKMIFFPLLTFGIACSLFYQPNVIADNDKAPDFMDTNNSLSFNDYHFYRYPTGDEGKYDSGPYAQIGETYTPLWSRAIKENGEYTYENVNSNDLPEKLVAKRRTIESNYYRTTNGNLVAYCLDFGKKPPSSSTTQGEKVKNEVLNVLKNGYPFKKGSEYGIKDIELEWATAVAIKIAQGGAYNSHTGELIDPIGMSLNSFTNGLSEDLSLFSYTYRKDYYPDNVDFSDKQFSYMQNEADKILNVVKSLLSHKDDNVISNHIVVNNFDNLKEVERIEDDYVLYGPFEVESTYSNKNVLLKLENVESDVFIVNKNKEIVDTLFASDNGVKEELFVKAKKGLSSNIGLNLIVDGAKELDYYMHTPIAQNEQRMVVAREIPVSLKVNSNFEYIKPNVEFYTTKINVHKKDNKELPLKDVEFSLIANEDLNIAEITDEQCVPKLVKKGEVIDVKKTDDNGNLEFYLESCEKIQDNKLSIVETKPLSGYIIDKKDNMLDLDENQKDEIVNLEIINKETEVVITKLDFSDEKPLPGAMIEIKNEKGEIVYHDKTNEKGEVVVYKLPIGKYSFRETLAPDGYVISDEILNFEIMPNGEVVGDTIIKNKKSEVVITKVDKKDNSPLEKAKIEVKDENGNVVFTGQSNEFGQIKIQSLKQGKYFYQEIEAPNGYALSKEVYTFEINENGKVVGDLIFENEKTNIIIQKLDRDNNKGLENAIIDVFDKNDNLVFSGTTDKDGLLKIVGLPSNQYYFKERVAPKGYELSNEKIDFTINEFGEVDKDLILYNDKIKNNIPKDEEKPTINTSVNNDKNINIVGACLGVFAFSLAIVAVIYNHKKGKDDEKDRKE